MTKTRAQTACSPNLDLAESDQIQMNGHSTSIRKRTRSESKLQESLRSSQKSANGAQNGELNALHLDSDCKFGQDPMDVRSKIVGTLDRKERRYEEVMQESQVDFNSKSHSPGKWKSPRRCLIGSQKEVLNKDFDNRLALSPKSPRRRLSDQFLQKSKWNLSDSTQMNALKEALHVSVAPSAILCREEEQKRIFDFCKNCIEQEKAGSLYVCGCPGTGKTLSMEKVKGKLVGWATDGGFQVPEVLSINCTSLINTFEIFNKIVEKYHPWKKTGRSSSHLQHLQDLFCQKTRSSVGKMMLIIVDEMDYLITKDRAVLHDIFMLTSFPFSKLILVGIANAIDLADRFLPKLQSVNCKPQVITFRAYSKDQILMLLRQRLLDFLCLDYHIHLKYGNCHWKAFQSDAFQPQALELCARKVAAASGDMRKALSVCRSAIELLEAELKCPAASTNFSMDAPSAQPVAPASDTQTKQEINIVRIDHMAIALSKAFKSVIVDTIQSLPQHQQIILCSVIKLFRQGKKETTVGELNKSYSDICRSVQIPPVNTLEFSNICRVLGDQGILKLGSSKEDRRKRITLKVDDADITFALQGIRFFRSCLH